MSSTRESTQRVLKSFVNVEQNEIQKMSLSFYGRKRSIQQDYDILPPNSALKLAVEEAVSSLIIFTCISVIHHYASLVYVNYVIGVDSPYWFEGTLGYYAGGRAGLQQEYEFNPE